MKARPGTVKLTIKLVREELDALGRIAAREGLAWGGVPSRVEAIRWLIARDREAHRPGESGS